jgi:O-antigen/teichoic acid export membrane protein
MIRSLMGGAGIGARLIRSSGWISLSFGVSQVFRLASNLILTRLLFPEAFGLMALITVFLVGLIMLSDIGVSPSIQQSARGDDPDFVNTAWTIQVIRGGLLWLACCVLGVGAAWFYGDPQFEKMLPVAGLSLLIAGFDPTRIDTASRHLNLSRVTLLDLLAQVIGLIGMLLLVWMMRTVWALVIGGVFLTLVRTIIMSIFLPGPRNRFHWAPDVVSELIHFGKWIFLSTLCGFLLTQGDKAILGKYLSLKTLGIYNIGYFLASFPQALTSKIMAQVMIPLHREHPPGASAENFAKVRRARFGMTCAVLVMQFTLAFTGIWVVDLLYDSRFLASGSIVVAVACMNVPYLIGMTYDYSALSRGDSRGVFHLLLAKAAVQTLLFILGMEYGGIVGAFIAVWLSQILMHPLVARLAYKHGAWDPLHDVICATAGFGLTAAVLWFHWDGLKALSLFASAQ